MDGGASCRIWPKPLFSQVIIHDRFVSIHLIVVISLCDACEVVQQVPCFHEGILIMNNA